MNPLLVFALIGLASWVLRIAFLTVAPLERLPEGLRDALDHLAPAVLAAIVVVDLDATLAAGSGLADGALTLALAALIGAVAWRTHNLVLVAGSTLLAVVVLDIVLG